MTVTAAVYDSAQAVFRPWAEGSDPPLAGAVFLHTQDVPANIWALNHDLGTKFVEVIIFGASGVRIYAQPDYAGAGANSIAVSFDAPLAGRAYVRSL